MSRLQELSDSFDESQTPENSSSFVRPNPSQVPSLIPNALAQSIPFPLPSKTASQDATSSTAPALPPAMDSVKSRSVDEVLEMMNRTPLFMTSLDETDGEGGENVELEALRALQYEGSKVEIAQGFRERGNEMARAKMWKDGKEFYGKGIAVLSQKDQGQRGTGISTDINNAMEEDAERMKEVEEACYINRALCNLELKNYRSCTHDCAATLRLNLRNVKAYYRSAQALLALDKVTDAEDACARGLNIEPSNSALRSLTTKIEARKNALNSIAKSRRDREERAKKEEMVLKAALRARGIKTRSTEQPPEMEDAAICLTPDPVSPKSTLTFPVVLLYPLHLQSDFIKAFSETDSLASHMDYILPLPWDESHEYTMDQVEGYMETSSGGMVKVGRNVSLLKTLSSGKVEVIDGIVKISVVPKGRATEWIEEVKKRQRHTS